MSYFALLKLSLSLVICSLFLSLSSHADTPAFKCQENGKTIFSQTPCKGMQSTPIEIKTSQIPEEETQRALKRHQHRLSESNKNQKASDREFAKQEAASRRNASKNANTRKQCENLQMKSKWAKEDLRSTQPRGEMKAQVKLKRAQEKADLACKNS
jgi:Skp family chaperone for outer membrane proteins